MASLLSLFSLDYILIPENKLSTKRISCQLKLYNITSVNDADYASPFEYNGEIEAIVIDADAIEISRQEETQKDLHAD